jgi:argininosuccinate synthase
MNTRTRRIVLAYSGGLDASAAIPWLAETHAAEVITVTLDLGQGGELEDVRDRALATGAVRAHVLDVREEFARDYVLRALKADALHETRDPMPAALSRPLIARKLVEIAGIEQSDTVAHGGQVDEPGRLDAAVRVLNPALTVIAAVVDWGMTRADVVDYARKRRVPGPVAVEEPDSVDSNLWGRRVACGALQDPWTEPPEKSFTLTKSPSECPSEPAYLDIAFERGAPTTLNGVCMPLTDLIGTIGVIAGAHGVGRIDLVESRAPGARSRQLCEAPAAVILHAAHAELQKLVTSKEAARFSRLASLQYADLIDTGQWFTPLREALDAFVDRMQERVTGGIRLKLFKGDARVVGRQPAQPPAGKASGVRRLRIVAKTH